jgi:hypothetical protein
MKRTIPSLWFCVFLTGLAYGQTLVEPKWGRFTGVPPEEVAELSGEFGLSLEDLRLTKPNLDPVMAAAKGQYQESTICDIDGSIVSMTSVYYIDEELGYYASAFEIESDDTGFINDHFVFWEELISDTFGFGPPSVTRRFPGTILSWRRRNRWPAFTISQPPANGTRYRAVFNQYSQLGINPDDPVNHRVLVQQLADSSF